MTDKLDERKALEELVACSDAAQGKAWLEEPDPLIARTQAAWKQARAVLATAPADPPHAEDRIERAVLIKQLRDAADALEYADGYIEGALEVIDAYAEEKAATPSRLASGPSQEGADGSAAAPPTAPAEPPKDGEALTWRQGITLSTRQTRQWTEQQRKDNDAIERCMVFARFSDADEGRSRIHIGTCKSAEDAERIVTAHNDALEKRLSAPPSGEVAALIERIDAMLIAERAIVVAHNSDDAGIDDIGQVTKQHSHALAQCWRDLKLAITGAGTASVESLAHVSADGPMQAISEPGGTRSNRFGQPPPSSAPPLAALIERLQTESDQCRNDGASDIAELVDDAIRMLARLSAPVPDKEK